jgi:secreted Zn-dependent insulinase-like peptidase
MFLQPHGCIYYLLRSPMQMASVDQSACLDLFTSCLLQNLIEDVYPADLAQLGYSVYSAENGLVLKVG